MPKRTGLGRGLDALIPGNDTSTSEGIIYLSVEQIVPNPRQPRDHFDEQELLELSESIKEYGVIQPVIVTQDVTDDQRYILIAGERRWLASRRAGLEKIPALVRDVEEQRRLELALIENVQRSNLDALESAEAYRQLIEDFNLTHEDVAKRVFKNRSTITNTLRLLNLSPEVQAALKEGKISEGHGRALLALPNPEAQNALLPTVINHELNVRQTEELVRKLTGERTTGQKQPETAPEIIAIEERLRSGLGTKVTLTHHKKGGTITIHYYSLEELDALVETLCPKD